VKQSEIAALSVLAPGGLLSAAQIQRDARLTSRGTRNALAQLATHGLIAPCGRRKRWQITEWGRAALEATSDRVG
jgi:DNA-binding IclR family transcriptional regulator